MHLQFPLAILTSLLSLPLSSAVPFAVVPTNDQWQAASARYQHNVNNVNGNGNGNTGTLSSAGSGEAGLLRDAAIFATRSRSTEKIKVKRQVRVHHDNMHALDRRASHKRKRACAVKQTEGEQALLAPAPAASSASATVSEYVAESAPSAAAPSELAPSDQANVGASDNGVIGGLVDAIFPVHVNSRWTTAESQGNALSCKLF
jgi:hypothetical protein